MLIAGLVGGLAEVAWIAAYTVATPVAAGEVLRQIVASVAPALAGTAFAPALGLGIHLALSVLLGLAFGFAVWRPALRHFGRWATLALAIAVLAVVWAINFLVLLPVLNPQFVELMPLTVTLASKLLFGVAMALTLQRHTGQLHA
jgi:hypothetical protein